MKIFAVYGVNNNSQNYRIKLFLYVTVDDIKTF
jgi:hypothetical protein